MCGYFVFLSSFLAVFTALSACPFMIALSKMGAAGCVLETVLLSKFAELL